MKKLFYAMLGLMALAACTQAPEKKVMARFVPERADDFVFENNLIAGRFYGQALEGNPTSPGLDIWVKLPGKLVADEWYKGYETQSDEYYHHDHGGKDCYKVSVSLGGGASTPLIDGQLRFPATNYRSYDIVEETPEKVVFTLHYPEWEAVNGVKVSLDKTVTVTPDTYFCDVEDIYTFTGRDTLAIAAGINVHAAQNTVEKQSVLPTAVAIWEHASDQTFEPEDGMLGVAVVMPEADATFLTEDGTHLVACIILSDPAGPRVMSRQPKNGSPWWTSSRSPSTSGKRFVSLSRLMKIIFHTVGTFFVLLLTIFMVPGCSERVPEDTTQREIEAISQMRELSLVEYRVRKIVKANDEGEWYKIGDRKILLSCTAYLKAGIDLSGFSAENVDINRLDGSATVTIPHAKLLSLDMPASEIREEYDHVTMLRQSFTAEERNALLRQGEKQIRSSVPSLGILEKAEENARRFFESVFTKMGFTSVEVVFE